MIVLRCAQRSEEWHEARRGVVTASNLSKILTPKGKLSAQADAYMFTLLAEWLSGNVEEPPTSAWMDRGIMLEPEACSFYQLTRGVTLDLVGFCYLDERLSVGCSPDALVGDDGGLEIKCPSGKEHVRFLLTGEVPAEYLPQIQGSLWITGRKWWDYLSYHPDMRSKIVRVERDEVYIDAVRTAVHQFLESLGHAKTLLMTFAEEEVSSVGNDH